MKLLIAIMSCARDQGQHQVCRDTWLAPLAEPGVGAVRTSRGLLVEHSGGLHVIDYTFFMGQGTQLTGPDESIVNALDDYEHVTEKSREIFKYALGAGYDYVLHCGRDTYVNIRRLLDAILAPVEQGGLGGVNYAGNCGCCADPHFTAKKPDPVGKFAYASGGAGSLLSRRALELIVGSPLYHVADDLLYGWVMGSAGFPCYHDPRFQRRGAYIDDPQNFTVHLSQGTDNYHPRWMRACHEHSL